MSDSTATVEPATTGPDNARTVGEIYAAFGRGDIGTILAALADDVRWEEWPDNSAQRAGLSHMRARRGREDAAGFFAEVATWTVRDFAVLDVIGSGSQVVGEVRVAFDLPGGGRFADEELHLWTFDEAGRVVRFRHYVDTAKHIAAARGEDTVVVP
jgi:ketosteroid isomerase-like protein